MNKTIAYYSLGCKVNLYESEALINKFLDNGFTLKKFNDVCDVYLINTCTVTHTGDSKSRKIIREAIKRNKDAVIAVMGCYAELKAEEIAEIEGVDIIVGTYNRNKIYDLVMKYLNNKPKKPDLDYKVDVLKIKEYEEMKLNK